MKCDKRAKGYWNHCQLADRYVPAVCLWLEAVSRARCWNNLRGYFVLTLQETKSKSHWILSEISLVFPISWTTSLKDRKVIKVMGPGKYLGLNFAVFILLSKAFFIHVLETGILNYKAETVPNNRYS